MKVLGSPEAVVQLMVTDPPDVHELAFGVLSVKAETKGRTRVRALKRMGSAHEHTYVHWHVTDATLRNITA